MAALADLSDGSDVVALLSSNGGGRTSPGGAVPGTPDYVLLSMHLPPLPEDNLRHAIQSLVGYQLQSRLAGRRWSRVLKRAVDILGSASGLIVLLVPLLVVGIAIRLTSEGSALFVQPRHGKNGRQIMVLKFRTMHANMSDKSGVRQTTADDPRVTPLGRFLRRWNIDELPQLWNVLKGDMSLVGPRAHAIGMRAGGLPYEELIPLYSLRHEVKPGITGLAQVMGFRGETTNPQMARARIACDLTYIDRCSMKEDLRILTRTITQELRRGTGY